MKDGFQNKKNRLVKTGGKAACYWHAIFWMVYIKQRWSASFQSIPPSLIIEESYLQTFLHTLLKEDSRLLLPKISPCNTTTPTIPITKKAVLSIGGTGILRAIWWICFCKTKSITLSIVSAPHGFPSSMIITFMDSFPGYLPLPWYRFSINSSSAPNPFPATKICFSSYPLPKKNSTWQKRTIPSPCHWNIFLCWNFKISHPICIHG